MRRGSPDCGGADKNQPQMQKSYLPQIGAVFIQEANPLKKMQTSGLALSIKACCRARHSVTMLFRAPGLGGGSAGAAVVLKAAGA